MKNTYILLLMLLLGSCSVDDIKPEIIRPYFTEAAAPELAIGETTIKKTSSNSFVVTIQIRSLGKSKSATVGTVLSKTDKEPSFQTANVSISKNIITETGTYELTYSNIPIGVYYIRAYLNNGNKVMYGSETLKIAF